MRSALLKPSLIAAAFVVVASACGSSSPPAETALRDANQVAINPDDVATTTTTVAATTTAAGTPDTGPDAESDPTTTTTSIIPLNDDGPDAIDNLFSSMQVFNDCLNDNGQSFIGLPVAVDDGGDASTPQNDPKYIEALVECAAVSQIQGALAGAAEAGANIPNDEIEFTNRTLLHWSDCMKGRGWTLAEFLPDDRGLLQLTADMTPPAGETLLDSDDLQECREIATAQAEAEAE